MKLSKKFLLIVMFLLTVSGLTMAQDHQQTHRSVQTHHHRVVHHNTRRPVHHQAHRQVHHQVHHEVRHDVHQ